MLPIFNGLRDINFLSTLVRMLLATLCGALIGLERSYKNRPAGFRTHMLVCIGACVASLTGHYIYLGLQYPADISRIGAQVITGLGFIGAGTIIVTKKQTVKGLTTAAGLWAAGIAGLAIGAGFYEGGILASGLILLVEVCFANTGSRIRREPSIQILLTYDHTVALDKVLRYCKDLRMTITNLQVTSINGSEEVSYSAQLTLRPNKNVNHDMLLTRIHSITGIVSAEIL